MNGACRICGEATLAAIDLGAMPLANSFPTRPSSDARRYPLAVDFCRSCRNLQLATCMSAETLYADYLYFTPASEASTAQYKRIAGYLSGHGVTGSHRSLLEVGCNTGDLMRHLQASFGRLIGIDPSRAAVARARERGLTAECRFFDREAASELSQTYGGFDVVAARHCAAHNEDPHGIVSGAARALAPGGLFLMENAYCMDMLATGDVGQIYHEHMFYFSCHSVQRLFELNQLALIDAFHAPIQNGSMVFIGVPSAATQPPTARLEQLLMGERELLSEQHVLGYGDRAAEVRLKVLELLELLGEGTDRPWLYGASAKACTFLHYCGIDDRQLAKCVDSTPAKTGRFIPGTGIEILGEDHAFGEESRSFLLTAWNYRDEILGKMRQKAKTPKRILVPYPVPEIVNVSK